MKKITALFIMILLALFPLTGALAAGDRLTLDNTHVYEGMDSSYSDGYSPAASGGTAIIIVPLVYEGTEAIEGQSVTAALDLGSTADSPFVYANYEKTVTLASHTVDGGGTVEGYLVRFEIPLSDGRIMGAYPVTVNTNFTAGGSEVEQSFTVYVTITDGIDPNATEEPAPTEAPEETRTEPKIIVSRYAVTPSVVTAGEDFDIDLTLYNTETKWHAKNIVVTYTGATSDILPGDDTNTVFIDEIPDEESADVTLHLTTRLDADPEPQQVNVIIEYEDSAGSTYTASQSIWVEIRQEIRLELDEVSISDTVEAGDSIPVSLQVFNMGKSTLYNVLCTLTMPGAIPEGSAYLGNLGSGTSATAEIYTFFGTLDMGDAGLELDENDDKYGWSAGTMTVTYEDEYGESYTEVVEVSITIERPVYEVSSNDEDKEKEEETPMASQWWVSLVLLAGIGTILYGVISYRRKVQKLRREYGDEDI